MTRCTRCILPDTVPGVAFDEKGVCSACRSFVPFTPLGETALRAAMSRPKRDAGSHDCLIPLSGGRDSTYTLYLAKAIWGLNPLAVHYDNEFRHPQAVVNMERACRRLGVELRIVRSPQGFGRRIVRSQLRLTATRGAAEVASSFCRPCVYGYLSAAYQVARTEQISWIFWGHSRLENIDDLREHALTPFRKWKWSKLLSPHFYRAEWLALRQRRESPVPGNAVWSRRFPVLRNSAIREISVFDYVPWERRVIKETIMRELGWEKPAELVSTWRTDCRLHQVMNYFYVRTVGCTLDAMGYCNMINARQMTRAEALEQEERALQMSWSSVAKVFADNIGLSVPMIHRLRRACHSEHLG